jgi:hypothetical protein
VEAACDTEEEYAILNELGECEPCPSSMFPDAL